MANYALSIKNHNVQAHLDIENDIIAQRNGNFSFTLRINNGNICDYNLTEYVDPNAKYAVVKTITITELTLTPDSGGGG